MKIVPDEETQEKIDALDSFRELLAAVPPTDKVQLYQRLDEIFNKPRTEAHGDSNKNPGKSDEPADGKDTRDPSSVSS